MTAHSKAKQESRFATRKVLVRKGVETKAGCDTGVGVGRGKLSLDDEAGLINPSDIGAGGRGCMMGFFG